MLPRVGGQAIFAYLPEPGDRIYLRVGWKFIACTVAMLLHVVTSPDWTKKFGLMGRIVLVCPRSVDGRLEGAVPGVTASQNSAHFSPAPESLYCGMHQTRQSYGRQGCVIRPE